MLCERCHGHISGPNYYKITSDIISVEPACYECASEAEALPVTVFGIGNLKVQEIPLELLFQ